MRPALPVSFEFGRSVFEFSKKERRPRISFFFTGLVLSSVRQPPLR